MLLVRGGIVWWRVGWRSQAFRVLKSDVKVKDWLGSEGEVLHPRIRGSMRRIAGPFHTLFRSVGR